MKCLCLFITDGTYGCRLFSKHGSSTDLVAFLARVKCLLEFREHQGDAQAEQCLLLPLRNVTKWSCACSLRSRQSCALLALPLRDCPCPCPGGACSGPVTGSSQRPPGSAPGQSRADTHTAEAVICSTAPGKLQESCLSLPS